MGVFYFLLLLLLLLLSSHIVTEQDCISFSNLIAKVNSMDKISSLNNNEKGVINLRNGATIIVTQGAYTVGNKVQLPQKNDCDQEKTSESNNINSALSSKGSDARTKWQGHSQLRQRNASNRSSSAF